MKRTGIILSTLIFALSLNAHGVDLCTPKPTPTDCTFNAPANDHSFAGTTNYIDWYANCDNNLNFYGVAICSKTANSSSNTLSEISVDYDETAEELIKYCWCKLLAPFESSFVFSYEDADHSSCALLCNNKCRDINILNKLIATPETIQ